MAFCTKCGSEVADGTTYCPKCGEPISATEWAPQQGYYQQPAPQYPVRPDSGLTTAAKVFLIISCISVGWTLLPLCWMIPMTVHYFNCIKTNQPITTGFKVCTLLFVSMLAGIFMLCDDR